ncbi:IS1647 transposase [Streptomyces venezuelae ATCC 10712]|uniref:IS1647 transposase n=1 Tax=Streptomyces venezuelae (strain ATCC 10712 / CBS 650.69 / DSM 40230 / JCM 4526 / NBRC 13096 / PD 04745) TaxID=953739 RepID=F2R322_STRVP|nr:IS1647 transposase [Streptomyces venezuelae ATCC 10712]
MRDGSGRAVGAGRVVGVVPAGGAADGGDTSAGRWRTAGRKGGPLTGPNPTDRGKLGSKIHLICDRNGLPLSLGPANMHDRLGREPLVPPAPMAPQARDPPPHRPPGRRVLTAARPTSWSREPCPG